MRSFSLPALFILSFTLNLPAQNEVVTQSATSPQTHVVQPSDTLWKLSRKYHVSVESIREANHLSGNTIKDGSVLVIPGSHSTQSVNTTGSSHAAAESSSKRVSVPIGARLIKAARQLAALGIGYNEEWTPPGQNEPWVMDCSNTVRFLYRYAAAIDLGRTASDQYYNLRLQKKAWIVPLDAENKPDRAFLKKYLQPGDLLFWENTYEPKRLPPITHVMIFLGTNDQGQWIMAGSQEGNNGEHHRSDGGPDIYPFDPSKTPGGYRSFFGKWIRRGEFVAFGRPVSS